jgi:hypothetical protein
LNHNGPMFAKLGAFVIWALAAASAQMTKAPSLANIGPL